MLCHMIQIIITITADDVRNSLKESKLGKSAGIADLAAEHFI